MLLVYAEKTTSRLNYAFNLVFRDVLQARFELTTSQEEFNAHSGPKIAYSQHALEEGFYIQSSNLLFESGIIEQDLNVVHLEKGKALFGTTSNKSDLNFDLFAASFFMATRYEEYLPHKRDAHDRFEAAESIATQLHFLQQPVVNIWCEYFWAKLIKKYPSVIRKERSFEHIVTIDIDNAYAFKEKGFIRGIAGFSADLLSLNLERFKNRLLVLLGKKEDPYDTYDYQLKMIKEHQLKVIYFFLLGDYGINDKNIPISNSNFQSLIKRLSDYAEVGIHPSYGSNNHFFRLEKEVNALSPIIKREITQSRQHFLRLKFPSTYRNLIDLDILNDYTMGYANQYGFRSGLCTSYYFYDLDLEVETRLQVRPFAIMEGTLKYYLQIEPHEALAHYEKIIEEVKKVNGTFISLWHNETLSDQGEWKGWRAVFEGMIRACEK